MKRLSHDALVAMLMLAPVCWATDGFSVSVRYGKTEAIRYLSWNMCGDLVRYDIRGDALAGQETIYSPFAWYPSISFDGTRVGFYRSAARLENGVLTGAVDSGYVSVINKDGTNLRDLVKLRAGQYAFGANFADCEGHFLDWPAGDWIYYERPPKTGEIWRVNVSDPTLHHLVVRYNDGGNGQRRPENCACFVDGQEGFWLRRFQLSADAKYCAGMFKDYPEGQQVLHQFPPPDGYAPFTTPRNGIYPACNLSLSAGGNFCAWYFAGCHEHSHVNGWNREHNFSGREYAGSIVNLYTDIRQWTGRDVGTLGNYMRWAANSDKWLLVQATYNCGGSGGGGGNQILCNWKDRKGVCPTGNSAGGYTNDAGDFWIDGGAANAGKYEDENGNWISVTPRDFLLDWSASGANPYEVSVNTYPPQAQVRYTLDGTEPDQASPLLSGPLDLTPDPGGVTQMKAKAFKDGFVSSETESRVFVPSAKTLPAGYMKELLCLENEQGNMGVPAEDTLAVWQKYAGEGKSIPFEGDQVTVNGHTYTWHLQTDDDGLWNASPTQTAFSFWYTTVVSPVNRMVRVGVRFQEHPHVWCNGRMVFHFNGQDSDHEWTFGTNDGCSFSLREGANSVLMQMRPNPSSVFALRLMDSGGEDLTDLQYYPYTGAVHSSLRQREHTAPCAVVSVRSNQVIVRTATAGRHMVTITDAHGRVVREFLGSGRRSYTVCGRDLAPNVHFVTVVSGDRGLTVRTLP